MLYDIIGYGQQVLGQVEAKDAIEAWSKAGKQFAKVLNIRPAVERIGEESFWEQVKNLVECRGEKAKKLWTVAGGYIPTVPPSTALDNLKRMAVVGVLSWEYQEEAEVLGWELEDLFSR